MAGPSPENSYDAVEFVIQKLRIVYVFLAGLVTLLASGAFYVYDIGVYVERARAHEEQQDARIKDWGIKLDLHKNEGHGSTRRRQESHLKVLLEQHDTIRELILEMAPMKKRARLRRVFQRQRDRERDILLGH
jgi:hypothetical protein